MNDGFRCLQVSLGPVFSPKIHPSLVCPIDPAPRSWAALQANITAVQGAATAVGNITPNTATQADLTQSQVRHSQHHLQQSGSYSQR